MCNHCDKYGFDRKCCNYCGIHGDKVFISISIRLDIKKEGFEFPYTETDMCKKCWDEIGIEGAFQHNKNIMDFIYEEGVVDGLE